MSDDKKYRCVRSAVGSLYNISDGGVYTAADFRPGGLRDAMNAGFLRVDEPEEPTRKAEPKPAPRKRKPRKRKAKK